MLEYIERGKSKAITREALCSLTGLTDRAVRRAIQAFREEGCPIVATDCGYYIAESQDEFELFIRQYTAHAKSIFKTAKKMEESFYHKDQLGVTV